MLYTALYMASTRTQVYLTAEQRRKLDEIAEREHRSMADVIREALDAFLSGAPADPASALKASFGAMPDLTVPSRDEWDHRA